ncbi:MAG: 2-dehydropantoate 2-reductase [Pseudomonadota bacterium]
MGAPPKIGIVGAGSIGCYVGGLLAQSGAHPRFLARPHQFTALRENGLTISSLSGDEYSADSAQFGVSGDVSDLNDTDIVLVCVKSGDTAAAVEALQPHLKPEAVVVSLQNGIDNAETLARGLPSHQVLAGMVAFNVVQRPPTGFHRATEGGLYLRRHEVSQKLQLLLQRSDLPVVLDTDMKAVLWSKLLLNLNNALNALSGLPLKSQLEDRSYRRVFAAMIDEALAVVAKEGVMPKKIGKASPKLISPILRLPTPLFRFVAGQMLKIDPTARTSMADDLEQGRKSEIVHLNGAVVAAGRRHGVPTQVNQRICELTVKAFAAGRSPQISGEQLLRECGI